MSISRRRRLTKTRGIVSMKEGERPSMKRMLRKKEERVSIRRLLLIGSRRVSMKKGKRVPMIKGETVLRKRDRVSLMIGRRTVWIRREKI